MRKHICASGQLAVGINTACFIASISPWYSAMLFVTLPMYTPKRLARDCIETIQPHKTLVVHHLALVTHRLNGTVTLSHSLELARQCAGGVGLSVLNLTLIRAPMDLL